MPRAKKLALVGAAVDALAARFEVLTLARHAADARARELPVRELSVAPTTR